MEEHGYRLIVEYFEKTISDDGLTQLQEWIEENPENLIQFSETIQILQAAKLYLSQPQQADHNWERIQAHVHQQASISKKRSAVMFKWLAVAATGIIFCACGLLGYKQVFKKEPTIYVVFKNANGKRSKLLLPDSSAVYLAGGSTIKYAPGFKDAKRAVYLDGEAYFEVVHQTQKPFTVKSGDITTVVLGTSFNVKAYAADSKVAITVKTGKVGITANAQGKTQLVKYLMPNEHIEIDTQSGLYTFNNVDAAAVSSWINNDFVFYNTPLKDIAASLEHHYGVRIEFTNPDLKSIKLTTRFTNISIMEVMEDISVLSGLSYTQKGSHIFFTNNNQRGGKIMK